MAPARRTKRGRKADADEEEDSRPVAYMFEEIIDVGVLREISTLMSLNQQVATLVASMLALYKDSKIGAIMTKYYYPEPNVNNGRAFAGSPSIQSLKGSITRLCCHSLYKEIDIVKCAPTMLLHIADKYVSTSCPLLTRYVYDTPAFFEYIRGCISSGNGRQVSDALLKQCVNSLIHTGSYADIIDKSGIHCGPVQPLEDMQNEVNVIRDKCVLHPVFEKMWDACANKTNRRGSFTSLIWQHIEGKAVRLMIDYLTVNNMSVSVLKHDGLLVRWTDDTVFPADVLRAMENHIRRDTEGIRLSLAVKSLTPTSVDLDMLRGRKHLHLLPCDTARIIHCVQQSAFKHKMIRVRAPSGDVQVFKPHPTIPCVSQYNCKCDVFVNQVIIESMSACGTLATKAAFDWMENTSHDMFPLLTRECFRADVVAFPNGYLALKRTERGHLLFHPWTGGETFKTRHYMSTDAVGFNPRTGEWELPETPLWTNMLTYQLGIKSQPGANDKSEAGDEAIDNVQVRWLEAHIGRLNYEINELDNWQVCLILFV
jgi:hypothetical protein